MSVGRPTEFDRQEALEKSMELFWKNGYEATSLAALIEEMGIGRQSLYNAFGGKHKLFIEAAEHYINSNGQHLVDAFKAPGSPLGNIRKAMEQTVEKTIKSTLDRAVEEGELSPDSDTRAIARFLNCTVHGLVVMHKASASRAALKDVVKIALTALK